MQFQPPDNGNGGLWFADKLGEWVASNDIVPGGSQHLQGVMEKGLRYNASDGMHSMTIGSLDAGHVATRVEHEPTLLFINKHASLFVTSGGNM